MAKFNVVQKKRRAAIAERKRAIHGDPLTSKLKLKPQPLSISGKRKRKLFKKWRREQKEPLEKCIQTMEDIEMAVAEDTNKSPAKFHLKKRSKLKIKQLKRKGKKNKKLDKPVTEASGDTMIE